MTLRPSLLSRRAKARKESGCHRSTVAAGGVVAAAGGVAAAAGPKMVVVGKAGQEAAVLSGVEAAKGGNVDRLITRLASLAQQYVSGQVRSRAVRGEQAHARQEPRPEGGTSLQPVVYERVR